MPEPLTISNAPLDHPGMDYAFMRQAGIKLIEQLAGSQWTDYNAHDPGITILESLCYAVTDLSYRLSFSIGDLLAFPASETEHPPLFLTARDSLTVNPLTLNDYRKLLLDIDIKGVRVFKNAWLEIIASPQPNLFYDASNAKLTLLDSNLVAPVPLKGLYRVLLEKKQGLSLAMLEEEGMSLTISEEEEILRINSKLINAAKAKLNQHRNLCEDFDEFKVLAIEKITVTSEVEIADHVDPNQLMAQLYAALDRAISPSIDFLSLSDLLNQGVPVAEIFVGPQLNHGFIDDAQLEQFQRKTELRTSDLIHVMMDLPGVKTVRSITLKSDQSSTAQDWALDLNPNRTPQLESLQITLFKGQMRYPPNETQVQAERQKITSTSESRSPAVSVQDIPIPTGDYRELSEYESLQSEFPIAYGISELGLPAAASDLRKAQAKQLQAYLMVFDQILANYFAQLDQVRELFALGNAETKTYFTQSIAHFPGAKEIFQGDKEQDLDLLQEDSSKASDRKQRLLNHLIAQYSETFIDDSLLYPNPESTAEIIQRKANFARDYRQVSAERGQAINYTLDPNQVNSNQPENVSGLKRRIAQLLGIESDGRSPGSGENEGFYVMEHILLRPRQSSLSKPITQFTPSTTSDTSEYVTCTSAKHGLQSGNTINVIYSSHYNNTYTVEKVQVDTFEIKANFVPSYTPDQDAWVRQDVLSFSEPITRFTPSTSGYVTCTSAKHGLQSGDTINVIYSSHYNNIYIVENAQDNTFEIKPNFVPNDTPERNTPEQDAWVRQDQHPDPFSLQISIILPDLSKLTPTPRFGNSNFKQLVEATLIAEVPAHISFYLHWLIPSEMTEFEGYYNLLLQHLSGTASDNDASKKEAKDAVTRLINFLGLGSTKIPAIPALIGYMVIGDASGSAPQFVIA